MMDKEEVNKIMKLMEKDYGYCKLGPGTIEDDINTYFAIESIEATLSDYINNYKEAYFILMEYWDSLSDEQKPLINERMKKLGL